MDSPLILKSKQFALAVRNGSKPPREMFIKLCGDTHNLCRLFVCSGRRGRRLPVAIVLRFDRVGRREPPPTDVVSVKFQLIMKNTASQKALTFKRRKAQQGSRKTQQVLWD